MTPTLYTAKEQLIADTPLLLFDCTFSDGTDVLTESWSTHAVLINGTLYQPRVLKQNVFQMQIGSDLGIDTLPKITIELANADSYISEINQNIGVKGGQVTVSIVFYSFANSAPSSNVQVLFKGILDSPDLITEQTFRVSASNRLSLQRVVLPDTRIQKRCPWTFPADLPSRQQAASGGTAGQYSRYYRCGYSPDVDGGCGNFEVAGASPQPYTACAYTRSDCTLRGMFNIDTSNRTTARFGGIEFVPPTIVVRSAGEKGSHLSPVDDNEARYNDFVPLIYGTAWFHPSIVFSRNDGNLTHFELLLGMGPIEDIQMVLVNSIEIPAAVSGQNMTGTGWYTLVSSGTRSGAFNLDFTDAQGNPLGDPYGSMAYLAVVVPNSINDGSDLPSIEVLIDGLLTQQYDANSNSLGQTFSNNPAWVILDMLQRIGWAFAELDMSTFAATASYCAEQIQTTDLFGNPVMTPRFQCNLVIKSRRAASDVIRGIRNGSRLLLRYGSNGLLQLIVENTVALQQPALPANSNAVSTVDGGWAAYEFGDGTNGTTGIARTSQGASSVSLKARSSADTPNRFSAEFQDAFNDYQQDSLSVVDVDDVAAMGQEITSTTPVLGLPHYDQAARILTFFLSKSVQGNSIIEFTTSAKALGLTPGDIITFTYNKEGFSRTTFRVTGIQPGPNYRTAVVTAQLHMDAWYDDTNGQTPADASRRQGNTGVNLPRPLAGVVLDSSGTLQFGVSESWSQAPDGTATVTASIAFAAPGASTQGAPDIPLLSLVAGIQSSGGSITSGQTLYYAVTSVGASGAESPLSFTVQAAVNTGSSTNTISLTGLSFPSNALTFNVYRGPNPSNLFQIASHQPLTQVFVDLGLPVTPVLPPDPNYDHADFYWRMELQPETPVTIFGSNTIGSSDLELIPGTYDGMVVRITGGAGIAQELEISTNTTNTLTLASPWVIQPDSTSLFVIAQGTYQFGATTQTSPAQFTIPNQALNIIEISGRAANSNGFEAPYGISPLTRYRIGGAPIDAVDSAPPAIPTFGVTIPNNVGGTILFGPVSFLDLTNTSTATAGTYAIHYLDELNLQPAGTLTAGIGPSDTTLTVSTALTETPVFYILIDLEILAVSALDATGISLTVTRGAHGTIPAAHLSGADVFALLQQVCVVPFVKDFFGTAASGDWGYPYSMPNVRIMSTECTIRNSQGNSPTNSLNFVNFGGYRTLSGGQLSFQIGGFLSVQTGAAPDIIIDAPKVVGSLYAVVKQAAVGASIIINLNLNGSPFCSLTIADGAMNSGAPMSGANLSAMLPQQQLSIDIASVGLSVPGSDLTVTLIV